MTAVDAADTAPAAVALDLARAATAAHVALSVGWPAHARELAQTTAALAEDLAAALEPLLTALAVEREHDERRSGTADAIDELRRRHLARRQAAGTGGAS